MVRCKRNREKLGSFIQKFSRYGSIGLLSVVLLAESVGARETLTGLQIAQPPSNPQEGKGAQQPATVQQETDTARAAAKQADDEGMKLHQQGTAESLRQAIGKWEEALVLWQKAADKKQQAFTLLRMGFVYNALGEKQKALSYYNQALPLSRKVADKGGEAATLNNIGQVYNDLGEKQKALSYYNQALPLSRKVADQAGEATTLNNIGGVYNDLGEKQKALSYYNQALPLSRAVDDKGGEATILNNIGLVYSDLGGKQKALSFYNQALPLRREVVDRGGEATTLNNIGRVYSDLGEKQKALEFYNQALTLFSAVGDKGGEANTLGNLAKLERNRDNLEASLKQIETAIDIIEELRKSYTNKDLQSTYFASMQGYYQFKTNLLMELHKKNPSQGYDALALNNNEHSRARVLIELLAEANAKVRRGANPELLQKENDLLQQIEATQSLLQQQKSGNQKEEEDDVVDDSTKKEEDVLENLLDQYRELQATIRQSSPKYANLKYPQPLDLQQIQQQLDKDTVLLQYSIGEERSYLWAVTPTSLTTYELPGKQAIEIAAEKFKSGISSPNGGLEAEVIKASNDLSKILLAPVADKLPGKRLVIVADGALQTIPFAALPLPNPEIDKGSEKVRDNKGGELSDSTNLTTKQPPYQPLILNHEIVNLPSASAIAIQRQELANRKPAPKALAILADPVYSATDPRVTGKSDSSQITAELQVERSALDRSAKNLNRSGFARLLGTEAEAQAILKLIPENKRQEAFNFDANYSWATSGSLNQYRIIHFATHGLVNPENPELSGIVLSLVDKQGKQIRGFLRLGDLFNLDYPAELIVLSACETGLGKNVNGEGLVGLTRGLMYAGAARVAVSLWKVNDDGTSVLMQEFYKQMLQENKTPAAALRAAQIKLWKNPKWQKPYYWGGFTVSGEWR
jgi:CHAT domain-containing protein/tetratricopeptide (TPR) repeat protein